MILNGSVEFVSLRIIVGAVKGRWNWIAVRGSSLTMGNLGQLAREFSNARSESINFSPAWICQNKGKRAGSGNRRPFVQLMGKNATRYAIVHIVHLQLSPQG